VVHMALPGSIEGYYQEIGRAGRDGQPARALLLYGWVDRKIHESFLERDYPPAADLAQLLDNVPDAGIAREELAKVSPLDEETTETALGKLYTHGGVKVDSEDVVRRGEKEWRKTYEAIRKYRLQQLDEVLEFAQSGDCRMARLVRYFGDVRDAGECGQCDACRPQSCVGKRFRPLTGRERAFAERILDELRRYQGLSTGNLYKNAFPASELDRRAFERLLDALARAKAVALTEDAFDKDGETIRFRRAKLGSVGARALQGDAILLEDVGESAAAAAAGPGVKIRRKAKAEPKLALTPQESSLLDQNLVDKLKAWRKVRAKAQGVPAFVVMSDRLLLAVAARRPATLEELARLKGAGKRFVEKNGPALLAVLRD